MAGKRTHGTGSITRRANGRFTAQVTDPAGHRRSVGTFDQRWQAEQAVAGGGLGTASRSADDLTLGDYLTRWLDGLGSYLHQNTVSGYRTRYRAYVAPHPIVGVPMGELGGEDFRLLYATLAARGGAKGQGLADATVAGVDRMLNSAMNSAVADGRLDRNPMPPRRVKVRRRERPWADAPQIRRLIAVVRLRDPDLEVAVRLGALYGLRRSEIAGLTWQDVAPDSVRVHTCRVISDGRAIDSAPKTPDSAATILLDPSTVTALDAHRRRRAELAEMIPGGDEHIYVSPFGQPLYPDTLSERFARCVQAFNLTHPEAPLAAGFTFHCLRHSFASNLVVEGVSTLVVAAAMRQTSVRMIEETYGHLAPSTVADAVARLAATAGD
jgi:integrase